MDEQKAIDLEGFACGLNTKTDKPINVVVLINTTNWENDGKEYPYYYNIPIEGVTSASRAEVFFDINSIEAAKSCEFSTEVATSDGSVCIRAKNVPETMLSANVQIGVLSATNTLHVGINGGATTDGETVEEHNVNLASHPDIRAYINEFKGRLIALEVANGEDITSNAFSVTFSDLNGVIAEGVWTPASARLEF